MRLLRSLLYCNGIMWKGEISNLFEGLNSHNSFSFEMEKAVVVQSLRESASEPDFPLPDRPWIQHLIHGRVEEASAMAHEFMSIPSSFAWRTLLLALHLAMPMELIRPIAQYAVTKPV